MNILVDSMPVELEVSGDSLPIFYDFRPAIRTMLAFEDNDLSQQEKGIVMLMNLYGYVPDNVDEALKKAQWFLNGGDGEGEDGGSQSRLFSFTNDSNMIFAAFRQTHGIDLATIEMHWWEFLALFMDMGQDTTFCQIISLRKRVKSGKATKEERVAASELGKVFEVPDVDNKTLEEREKHHEFFEKLKG